jgi:hypothetical protein
MPLHDFMNTQTVTVKQNKALYRREELRLCFGRYVASREARISDRGVKKPAQPLSLGEGKGEA